MYQAHFGLKRALFESGVAQDAAVFLAAKHEQIIANTKVALTTLDSAVVLTGTAGVGKTTLMASALRATSTRLALGWVTGAPLNGAELLELLLVEFGFNAHRVGRVERMQMWRQFLNEMSATESRVFVIVERADDLNPEVLRALDSVTAADPNGGPGTNLVLLGQPGLLDHLKAPVLESLRQRIRLRERLDPLTADELNAYLAHQVTRAGGQLDKVFAPTAVATLHELSGGIPRIANNLCETALTLAASAKENQLTSERLTSIAVAMFGMDAPSTAGAEPTTTVRAPASASASASASAAPPALSPAPVPAALAAAIPVSVASAPVASVPLVSTSFTSPPAVAFVPPSAPTYTLPPARTESAASIAVDPPTAAAPSTAKPAAAPVAAPIAMRVATPAAAAVVGVPPPKASTPIQRADVGPVATRTSDTSLAKPPSERPPRPTPAPLLANPPPVPRNQASVTARRTEPAPSEIDSFADTLTDSPDVQMPDLPVLTDAVEPPARAERPRARAEMAYARPDPPPPAPRAAFVTSPSAAPALPTPPSARVATPAPAASAPPKPAGPPAPKPVQGMPPNTSPESSEEDLLHQTQTVRALAAAKSIDDISNSMAETLFGEADLDMLSAALASSGWSETSEVETATPSPSVPAKPKPIPQPEAKTEAQRKFEEEQDPFDFLGLGRDAPLELIDDSPPSNDGDRKTANTR